MRALLSLCLLTSLATLGFCQVSDSKIKFSFSDTDASKILNTIGQQTGANIVYNVREKISVTLTISVDTTEQAIRNVVAAAGLSFKRFDKTFIIAKPDDLRKAVLPFASRIEFTVRNADPVEAAKRIESTFSAVTSRGEGKMLVAFAIPTDVRMLTSFVSELDKSSIKQTSVIVPIRYVLPAQLSSVVSMLFPAVKISTLGDAMESTRSIAITGPSDIVTQAVEAIEKLDVAPKGDQSGWLFELYEVKYASPVVLKDFLSSAMPEVQVTVGPETYTPMEPGLRTFSGQSVSGSSSSGGSSGSGSGTQQGSSQSGGGQGQGGTPQPYQRVKEGDRAKLLLLHGDSESIEKAKQLLNQFDIKPKQVKIEVRVVDVSPEKLSEFGFDFTWAPFSFKEAPAGTPLSTFPSQTRPAGLGQLSRVPWSLDSILKALVTTKEAKILARPSVQVLDNDDSTFFVGNTIRVRLASSNGIAGQTLEVREFPIGIMLVLRPRVNSDGNITLRIHPVVSSLTELNDDGLPQSTTREAATTVMIKNGQTVVVGGLIQEEMRRTVREIPILGQLPILGELFKSRDTTNRRSEIMVFITPTLVDDPAPEPKKEQGSGN